MVLLATVLCLLILMAVTALSYLTSTDATTSGNLVRELKATALAESIAVTAEARANTNPWSRRFWAPAAAPARLIFARGDGNFPTVEEGLENEDYSYAGVIKDTNAALHTYRIYIEVTWNGDKYTFSWDKGFEESLMGSMNRDATLIDKRVEDPGATSTSADNTPVDQLIDQIVTRARTPVPNSEEDKNKAVLSSLTRDTNTYTSATSAAAEPTDAGPSPLPLPQRPR